LHPRLIVFALSYYFLTYLQQEDTICIILPLWQYPEIWQYGLNVLAQFLTTMLCPKASCKKLTAGAWMIIGKDGYSQNFTRPLVLQRSVHACTL